jgi:hypothetical protein
VNDISRIGCYIETVSPLPLGTEVRLRLTITGILLDIGARVVWTTPQIGMGMYFMVATPEEEKNLAQILDKVTAPGLAAAAQQAERPQAGSATVRITREAAPEILARIIARVNEKGALTRQELVEIVKAHK